jgi:hypothetical protein
MLHANAMWFGLCRSQSKILLEGLVAFMPAQQVFSQSAVVFE